MDFLQLGRVWVFIGMDDNIRFIGENSFWVTLVDEIMREIDFLSYLERMGWTEKVLEEKMRKGTR